jgi:hypothetical protein
MNLVKLLDLLLAENPKSKGRGRNAARSSTLLVCLMLLWTQREQGERIAEKLDTVQVRLHHVEARLGLAGGPQPPTAALDESGRPVTAPAESHALAHLRP